MTQDESGVSAPDAPEDEVFEDAPVPKDGVLTALVDMFLGPDDELDSNSFGLTVTCNGAVVSGLVVSRTRWTQELAGLLEDGAPAIGQALSTFLPEAFDHAKGVNARRSARDLPRIPRRYLHMSQARIYTPNGNLDVPVWRGILEDISSWSLGSHAV